MNKYLIILIILLFVGCSDGNFYRNQRDFDVWRIPIREPLELISIDTLSSIWSLRDINRIQRFPNPNYIIDSVFLMNDSTFWFKSNKILLGTNEISAWHVYQTNADTFITFTDFDSIPFSVKYSDLKIHPGQILRKLILLDYMTKTTLDSILRKQI